MILLPDPNQHWSHSTNSLAELLKAMHATEISAIEADLVMGSLTGGKDEHMKKDSSNGSNFSLEAIMAHPPNRKSDLSMKNFISKTIDKERGKLTKHLKFDFKELEAARETLSALSTALLSCSTTNANNGNLAIFLNADIFPGPGMRYVSPDSYINAEFFIEACTAFVENVQGIPGIPLLALSLGFKVNYQDEEERYMSEDCMLMTKQVRLHNLQEKIGLVLALNARILSRNPSAFDDFMREFPAAQILAWTGTGEPPIQKTLISKIQQHAVEEGYSNRLGFDCHVQD